VRTARDAGIGAARAATPHAPEDSWLEKVVKYVPTEIVGAYIAIAAILGEPQGMADAQALWIFFGVLLALTPTYTLIAAARPGLPRPTLQAVAATIAFVAWVAAMGGPFRTLEGYDSRYAVAVMIVVTLLLPLLEKVWPAGGAPTNVGREKEKGRPRGAPPG
jgi:hypothetical protein